MKKSIFLLLITLVCCGVSSAQSLEVFEKYSKPASNAILDIEQIKNSAKKAVPRDSFIPLAFDNENKIEQYQGKQKAAAGDMEVLYALPDGYYYMGLSDFSSAYNESRTYLVGPAYYTEGVRWRNLSKNADGYEWQLDNPLIYEDYVSKDSTGMHIPQFIYVSDEEPELISYPPATVFGPNLFANSGSIKDNYWFGIEADKYSATLMYLGGKPTLNAGSMTFGITNLDHYNCGFTKTEFGTNQFYFGTNTRNLNSSLELFSKPFHPYVLDKVRVGLRYLSVVKNTEIRLVIHRVENGLPTDTIATASWVADDDIFDTGGDALRILFFDNFTVKNSNGEEENISLLEISDAIMVEVTGYNDDPYNIMAIADQKLPSRDGKSTAYIFRDIYENDVFQERRLYNISEATVDGMTTSLAIMLDITYTYLFPIEGSVTELHFPEEGGSKIVAVDSYLVPADFEKDESGNLILDELGYRVVKEIIQDEVILIHNVPKWLTIEIDSVSSHYKEGIDKVFYKITAAPNNVVGRWAEPSLSILGSELKFTITQGDVTGIGEAKVSQVNVVKSGSAFELTYNDNFNSVTIYDISGQKVYETVLPSTGESTISVDNLAKGIYLFRFNGSKSETVKVLN